MNCGGRLRAMTKKCISAAEADRLDEDDEMGRRFEPLCATGEGTDEQHAIRRGLIDCFERIQYLARPPVGSTKRVH